MATMVLWLWSWAVTMESRALPCREIQPWREIRHPAHIISVSRAPSKMPMSGCHVSLIRSNDISSDVKFSVQFAFHTVKLSG